MKPRQCENKMKIIILVISLLSFWIPQVGPQVEAATCPVDFTFFGGSRGGGKSDCLLGRQIRGAELYNKHWNGLILRRKYKEFAEMRRRTDGMIADGLPAVRIGGDQQTNYLRFNNGAQVIWTAIDRLEKANDHVGIQYTEISIDECTTFPFFTKMVDKLKGSCRSPHGVPCHMFGTGNPGGPGHNEVKEYFQLGSTGTDPKTIIYYELEGGFQESRVFIPSFLHDNLILCENDPLYVARLLSIKDPALRRAWIKGDWDVFIGQAFNFQKENHIIDPIPVPRHAPLYMTFDWGFGAPFSIGWWWVDADGRLYRFAEWYGWNETPNEGLRLEDSKIAKEINEREESLGIKGRDIIRIGGPDCFQKKPDYKGGGQGPPTSEVFAKQGIYLTVGDASRHIKIRQFRERLIIPEGRKELPMMVVYSTCKHFIRTIPSLCMDELRPEDIDTQQEDHCLHGDTKVFTDKGRVAIKDLVGKSGRVLTAGGCWTKFNRCRKTRKNTPIVEVKFQSGRSIKCTPDHRIYTIEEGWKEINSLTDETCHVSIDLKKDIKEAILCELRLFQNPPKNLMENDIGCVGTTSREKGKGFTGLFGNIIRELSRRAHTFITKTMIDPTTKSTTWNAKRPAVINPITREIATTIIGLQPCLAGLQGGMEATRDGNGTKSSTKSTVKIKSKLNKLESVSFAEAPINDYPSQNIVPESANNERGSKNSGSSKCVLSAEKYLLDSDALVQKLVQQSSPGRKEKVKSVKSIGKADVYCLDAAFTHAFAVEGGILVHNCYDEACHIFMARPMHLVEPAGAKTKWDKRLDELERVRKDDHVSWATRAHNEAMGHLTRKGVVDTITEQ